MMRILLASACLAALLSGCADDAKVDSAGLDFNGEGSGNHSDEAKCGDGATLAGNVNVDDGSVEVTVTDGSGDTQFSQTYSDDTEVESEAMDGASGTWTLTVTRAGDDLVGDGFRGSYAFTLAC